MQPLYFAFGMEIDVPSTEPSVSDDESNVSAPDPEVHTGVDEGGSDSMASSNVLEDGVAGVEHGGTDSEYALTEDVDAQADDTEGQGVEGVDIDEEVDENVTSDEETPENDTVGDGEVLDDTASSTVTEDGVGGDSAPDTQLDSATTTEDVASTTEEDIALDDTVPIVQDAESKYVFGDGDCTVVAEGEFYCVATGPIRQPSGDPRVYAEKDREGDKEIFYFDGVDVARITNNGYDDFAPVFDEETKRIVWQAMVSDRLQIMVHELETNITRQITTSRHNSSNPDIAGDIVVWQEWIGTNWEVMQTNVNTDGAPFEIEQLTDNAVHDMFPQIYEGLVTWQREKGDSWEVVLFDESTEKTRTLEKDENTKYDNPRFVLLFDSTHDNGDVETIGYDLETGDMMELGTKANRDPFIPVSPKDEVPDVPVSQNASSSQVKVAGREGDEENDLDV
jgi:beta propeller repeat protein